jgi:polysaccharide export outer membrane protein
MANKKSFIRGTRLSLVLFATLVVAAMSVLTRSVTGQQPGERARSVSMIPTTGVAEGSKPSAALDSDNQYRIGVGDQLTIQVFNRAQLSREERVDGSGMIRMPLIEEDIRAACRTENELAEEIARQYRERELLKSPSVYVGVKDFQSQPVAVIGSVNSPGKFMLQRRVRLRELLMLHAGGPSVGAGPKIQILATVPMARCEATPAGDPRDARTEGSVTAYDLADLLAGKDSSNPYVHQGDIINIPAAEQAFIVGNVAHPSPIPIAGSVTLARALAVAGGILANSKKDKIRITRETSEPGVTKEILVDLNNSDRSQGQDFALRPGDIVEVGTKSGALQTILKQMVPMAIGLPIQIIR